MNISLRYLFKGIVAELVKILEKYLKEELIEYQKKGKYTWNG